MWMMNSNLNLILAKPLIIRLRCWELPKSVQSHSILVSKAEKGHANFDPTHDRNTRFGDHYRARTNLNLAKPFIILIMRHWKGWDAVFSWINPNIQNLGYWSQNRHHPSWLNMIWARALNLTIKHCYYSSNHEVSNNFKLMYYYKSLLLFFNAFQLH